MTSGTFIIAEAGVNHNGRLDMALDLVDAAAAAGADAVKFQTFRAEELVLESAPKAGYQMAATGDAGSQLSMLRSLELSESDHRAIAVRCREQGIRFLSTPFCESGADLLHALGVEQFKIPSGEITNVPLLRHVASFGRPMLVSTGMSDLEDVRRCLGIIRAAGAGPVTLLHCVTEYPAPPDQINLRSMDTMRREFGVPVGYSDHSEGLEIAFAAVALGACVLEKHFTLNRGLPGPDHRASLEPAELKAMVKGIRAIEVALGNGLKVPAPCELANRTVVRRSLVIARRVESGQTLSPDDLASRRPGTGISPVEYDSVVGRIAVCSLEANSILRWEDLL